MEALESALDKDGHILDEEVTESLKLGLKNLNTFQRMAIIER